jgi:hypothetical protein
LYRARCHDVVAGSEFAAQEIELHQLHSRTQPPFDARGLELLSAQGVSRQAPVDVAAAINNRFSLLRGSVTPASNLPASVRPEFEKGPQTRAMRPRGGTHRKSRTRRGLFVCVRRRFARTILSNDQSDAHYTRRRMQTSRSRTG